MISIAPQPNGTHTQETPLSLAICPHHPQVGKLSPAAQAIIRRYTEHLSGFGPVAAWGAALTRELPWGPPDEGDYAALLGESEYAAW